MENRKSSSAVKSNPASLKATPCFRTFTLALAGSHSNCIITHVISTLANHAASEQPAAGFDWPVPRPSKWLVAFSEGCQGQVASFGGLRQGQWAVLGAKGSCRGNSNPWPERYRTNGTVVSRRWWGRRGTDDAQPVRISQSLIRRSHRVRNSNLAIGPPETKAS